MVSTKDGAEKVAKSSVSAIIAASATALKRAQLAKSEPSEEPEDEQKNKGENTASAVLEVSVVDLKTSNNLKNDKTSKDTGSVAADDGEDDKEAGGGDASGETSDAETGKQDNESPTIAPPGKKATEFQIWFNNLTCEELGQLYKDQKKKDTIKDKLRGKGGLHEWFMVAKADIFKKWGVSANEIMENTTETKPLYFVSIEEAKSPRGKHTGTSAGRRAHMRIERMIKEIDETQDSKKAVKYSTWLTGTFIPYHATVGDDETNEPPTIACAGKTPENWEKPCECASCKKTQ